MKHAGLYKHTRDVDVVSNDIRRAATLNRAARQDGGVQGVDITADNRVQGGDEVGGLYNRIDCALGRCAMASSTTHCRGA